MSDPLLEVRGLSISLPLKGRAVDLVEGIDFSVDAGSTLGLVGESGCGKSLTMLAVMGLLPAQAVVAGSIRLRGQELLGTSPRALAGVRGKRIGMIFQDPMTSLDPVMTIGQQIGEAIAIHDRSLNRAARRAKAGALLELVAIPFAQRRLDQYPHELSGGMRQRVMIAIAMANDPDLLIADEPTTALDVTVQAQILDLLARLRHGRRMGLILISHDLGIIAGHAEEVAVMYAGRICERGPVDQVFARPLHPYTEGLMASLPRIDRTEARLAVIPGNLPPPAERPSACRFHPRCARALPACAAEEPAERRFGARGAACHRVGEP